MRVSDYIAKFLLNKSVDLVFAISGGGNVRLIESICNEGIKIVCPHHEQAAVMAALARYRICGRPAVCIVTGGPGAANTLISLADAHLDSIPCIIIAGQEKAEFLSPSNKIRGKGVQGLDMVDIVKSVTKYAKCVINSSDIQIALERGFQEAYLGRPGPVWIEIPQDKQWEKIILNEPKSIPQVSKCQNDDIPAWMHDAAKKTLDLISSAKRPLLWVGHGVRLAGALKEFETLFNKLGVPALVSWQAADIIPDSHPLFVGRAGIYGQRWANLALQNADLLITLGTRLAIPQRGYNDMEFAREAKKVIVEIDKLEMDKFQFHIDIPIIGNVKHFIQSLIKQMLLKTEKTWIAPEVSTWSKHCNEWRKKYPMTSLPKNPSEPVNSYWFIDRLSNYLAEDAIILTDMGTSLTCTHATIRLKHSQRLITSTGLGEMGFGLPGAIGAALAAAPGRQIVLICGEGSLMFNLQELQTLIQQQLPIKLFLLNNNGYLSIKHTHNSLYGSHGKANATDAKSGITFPDFSKIAKAFKIPFSRIRNSIGLDKWIQDVLNTPGYFFAEVVMPEFQELVPKLSLKVLDDGSIKSPPLEDLYPFLSDKELAEEMMISKRTMVC
jgi:acetolactate synthase-1/2/3 large subunit